MLYANPEFDHNSLPSELHVKTCQRHVLTRNARNAEYWHMLLQVVM